MIILTIPFDKSSFIHNHYFSHSSSSLSLLLCALIEMLHFKLNFHFEAKLAHVSIRFHCPQCFFLKRIKFQECRKTIKSHRGQPVISTELNKETRWDFVHFIFLRIFSIRHFPQTQKIHIVHRKTLWMHCFTTFQLNIE